jgi:hypothetical protein
MPTLTRRRDRQGSQEAWLVYYGDVCDGSIGLRNGNPIETNLRRWRCGFYPGSNAGDCTSRSAATFEAARSAFLSAWEVFLSQRTEADFEEWRAERD